MPFFVYLITKFHGSWDYIYIDLNSDCEFCDKLKSRVPFLIAFREVFAIFKDSALTDIHCTHSLQNKIHNIVYAGFKGPLKTGDREISSFGPYGFVSVESYS